MRSVKGVLRERDDVLSVDEVDREPEGKPTLEVVCVGDNGISPAVLGLCSNHGLSARDVTTQGGFYVGLLVA